MVVALHKLDGGGASHSLRGGVQRLEGQLRPPRWQRELFVVQVALGQPVRGAALEGPLGAALSDALRGTVTGAIVLSDHGETATLWHPEEDHEDCHATDPRTGTGAFSSTCRSRIDLRQRRPPHLRTARARTSRDRPSSMTAVSTGPLLRSFSSSAAPIGAGARSRRQLRHATRVAHADEARVYVSRCPARLRAPAVRDRRQLQHAMRVAHTGVARGWRRGAGMGGCRPFPLHHGARRQLGAPQRAMLVRSPAGS